MPKTTESTPADERAPERDGPRAPGSGSLLDLQRSAGNAAVGALLRSPQRTGGVAAPQIRHAGALLARETATKPWFAEAP